MAEALGTVASIIAVLSLARSGLALLRDIKDASVECGALMKEIGFTRSLLLDLKDTLEEMSPSSEWTGTAQLLAQNDGPIKSLERDLQNLNARLAKRIPPVGSKKIGKNLTWPFSKHESEEMLHSIERQKTSLLIALENNQTRLALAIQEAAVEVRQNLREARKDIKEVLLGVSSIGTSLADQASRKILSWISPANPRISQMQILSALVPNTGGWLFETSAFKAWLAADVNILFCPGIPGAGKTSLAAQVIDYLETEHRSRASPPVIWVYCNYRESVSQTVSAFLGSLLKQLVQGLQIIPERITDLYKTHGNGETPMALRDIEFILRTTVEDSERVFVVVDALDECSERDGNREHLIDYLLALPPAISLMVTSRPILGIQSMFRYAATFEIKPHKDDLEKYIEQRLHSETKLHRIVQADRSLRQEIKDTLIAKNQGVFLMTKLHMNTIAKKAKYSKNALREAIADLPRGLGRTYEDAMSRIADQDEEDARLAHDVLSWVLLSFRRMTLRELQEALAVHSGSNDDDESLIDPDYCISVCGGLIVLDKGHFPPSVSFVHLSTEEFFAQNSARYFPNASYEIASTCLKQLLRKRISMTELHRHPKYAMNKFTEYAVRYAMLHTNAERDDRLFPLIRTLWASRRMESIRFAFAHLTGDGTTVNESERNSFFDPYTPMTALQLAIMHEYDDQAESLIKCLKWDDENKHNDGARESQQHIPAVCVAVYKHNLAILKLLHSSGADLNVVCKTRTGEGMSAIECAIARHDFQILEYLLDQDPKMVRSTVTDGRNALHFAARCRSSDSVALLLERGAAVDAKDSRGRTALHYLARAVHLYQHEQDMVPTAEVLMKANADLNAQDDDGWTPLRLGESTINTEQKTAFCRFLQARGGLSLPRLAEPSGNPIHPALRKRRGASPWTADIPRCCTFHGTRFPGSTDHHR